MTHAYLSLFLVFAAFLSACKTTSRAAKAQGAVSAAAFDPATVIIGPEFEFTFAPRADGSVSTAFTIAKNSYLKTLQDLCAEDSTVRCQQDQDDSVSIEKVDGSSKIKVFPHTDNKVVEIPLDPMTLDEAHKAAPLIDKFVFAAAATVGLVPGTDEVNRWSCHLNVSWPGLRAGSDGALLMRYFTDTANHPELASGILGGDIRNAPPLVLHNPKTQQAMSDLVRRFNRAPQDFASSVDVAQLIKSQLYNDFFWYSGGDMERYNAINVDPMLPTDEGLKNDYAVDSPRRLELRSFYMPKNADDLLADFRLVTSRLAYLAHQTQPLNYAPRQPANVKWNPRALSQGYSAEDLAKAFIVYATEMGLEAGPESDHLINPEVRAAVQTRLGRTSDTSVPAIGGGDTGADSPDASASEQANSRSDARGTSAGGESRSGAR